MALVGCKLAQHKRSNTHTHSNQHHLLLATVAHWTLPASPGSRLVVKLVCPGPTSSNNLRQDMAIDKFDGKHQLATIYSSLSTHLVALNSNGTSTSVCKSASSALTRERRQLCPQASAWMNNTGSRQQVERAQVASWPGSQKVATTLAAVLASIISRHSRAKDDTRLSTTVSEMIRT